LAAFALTLGVTTAVWADAERVWGDGSLPDILAVYDIDGDGKLSVEEAQAMKTDRQAQRQDRLSQWDLNGDGVIDDAEREAAREAIRQDIEDRRLDRYDEADINGDDCLTYEEFIAIPAVADLAVRNTNAPARIYDRMDADDNQCVSPEEFTGQIRHHRLFWRTPMAYRNADADTNGCLTLVEFSAIPEVARLAQTNPDLPAQLYDGLDGNQDDCLSLLEFLAPNTPHPLHWRTRVAYLAADVDTNGCLTLAEFSAIPAVLHLARMHPEAPARMYAQLDADDDGCLTLAEFIGMVEPPPGEWRTEAVYLAADADTNGCLTLVEFSAIPDVARLAQLNPQAPAQLFAHLDRNDDDCLSLQEFLGWQEPPPPPGFWRTPEAFAAADVDTNACLTMVEFSAIPEVVRMAGMHPEQPAMLFHQLDHNRNFCLNEQEFTAPIANQPRH
jgi:Ca2+-binding EF-hand superfamily protein